MHSSLQPKEGVFFNGQIFDAHALVADLIRQAKTRIVIIDNYIDDSVLVQLSKRKSGLKVDIYCGQISKQLSQDVEKHNEQYPGVTLHKYTKAHDRFLIIDEAIGKREMDMILRPYPDICLISHQFNFSP